MDSKIKAQAIAIAICVAALAIAMVFYVNRQQESGVSDNATGTMASGNVAGSNLTDAQLRDFLKDDLFFDPDPVTADSVIVYETPNNCATYSPV